MITASYVDSVLWFYEHWAAIVGVAPMPQDVFINPVALSGYLHGYAVSEEDQAKANHLDAAAEIILDDLNAFDRMRSNEADLRSYIKQLQREIEILRKQVEPAGK